MLEKIKSHLPDVFDITINWLANNTEFVLIICGLIAAALLVIHKPGAKKVKK